MPDQVQRPSFSEIKYNRLWRKHQRQLLVNEGLNKKIDRLEKELAKYNAQQGDHICRLIRYTIEHVFSTIRFAPTPYTERHKFDPPKPD